MSHNKNYGAYFKKDEEKKEDKLQGLRSKIDPVDECLSDDIHKEEITPVVQEVLQEESKVEDISKPAKVTAKVIGGKPCKMRFKPDQRKGQVINIIPHKAKVTVLEENGTWWKCTYRGITGYMMAEFLKKE